MVTLTPVDDDPFATPTRSQPKLEAVDYDPFAEADVTKNPSQQMAPASGVFPAVTDSGRATVPASTMLPQSDTAIRAPTPSTAPASDVDPGILAEAYGDTVKGWHSTKRGAFLTGYMTGAYDDVDNISNHLAASKEIENQYPSSPANRVAQEELERIKDSGAGGILPSLGVYAKNPRLAASTAIQSLPSMLSSLVTVPVGAIGGGLAAGPPGAVAGGIVGIGVGSAAADFGNAFEEYARDKWKPQNAAEWKAILTDPEKTTEAGNYAAIHAGMVGLFDAAGGKLGGKVGAKIVGDRIANTPGRIAATAVAGSPVSAAVGAGGEASGQLAAGGDIRDPGAVAGEFAGSVVTDVAAAGVEPTIKALNIGGKPTTPATPADVSTAYEGLIQQPKPEEISGQFSILTSPVREMYSPARQAVEEKGHTGSADQWRNMLRNAVGVKEEELRDIGFDTFLAENPNPTKKDVLNFFDENAIRIEETQRDNTASTPEDARKRGYQDFIDNGGQPDFWNQLGEAGQQPWIDGAQGQFPGDSFRRGDARYQEYTLPGERQGYTELTFHMPTRNVGQVEGEMGWVPEGSPNNEQRDFVGGHYTEPNVIAHARVTERTDVNGVPFALIEEIQSDWHQKGRKEGYRGEPAPAATGEVRYDPAGDAKYPWVAIVNGREYNRATNENVARGEMEDGIESANVRANAPNANKPPSGPFQQSWPELAFKRLLKWSADRGYRRVAWVDAKEQMRRYPEQGSDFRAQGMEQFYGKTIPSIAKKWAKRLGGTYGTMFVKEIDTDAVVDDGGEPINNVERMVQYIDIPQNGIDAISRGLPLYSKVPDKKGGATLDDLAGPNEQMAGQDYVKPLDELVKGFNLPVQVKLILHPGKEIKITGPSGKIYKYRNTFGMAEAWGNQKVNGYIHIALGHHTSTAQVWATITHELGHIIQAHKFESAPDATKIAVRAAYDEWKSKTPGTTTMNQLIQTRSNAISAFSRYSSNQDYQINRLSPANRKYWVSFEEWFAEQVARWATSNEKPLTMVEKFFKNLGQMIRNILKAASAKFNQNFEPNAAMAAWLNSFHTDAPSFAEETVIKNTVKTQAENQTQMGEEETAVEQQPETVGAREGIDKLFNGRTPGELKEAAAYADKFNKIYKWGLGIHQVADRNKHIAPLQEYVETIAVAQLTKQQVMIRAQEVLKSWNRLGERQADNVTNLIDDVQNMVYRTDDEVRLKVARFPTAQEFADLVKKHGVSQEGIAVFNQVRETFNEHLTRYEAVLRNEANKITDPNEKVKRETAITAQIRALKSKPYFPAMRFGDYTITIRNDAGQVIHFETFERERTRNSAAEAIQSQYGVSKDKMELGKLDRQVRPLMGVPTQLLDLMAEKLTLSKAQRDALEQLKFELSPAQSFKHRFQHKRRIAGYSMDFRRAYAGYFFHGANHLMKAMYADRLRALSKATKLEVKGAYDVTTRSEIVAYMDDHLENWLDPKSDWAAIRSIAFLWSLAWTPAAAAQNLTQTLMTTAPFLAAQFGDVKAVSALMRTGTSFTTWYKKGTLEKHTDFELRAIGRGIQEGLINEAMAPELAGYAEGATLGKGFGGNELQRGITKFNELGAKMFETAEQINRRLVFRATMKLAQENPGAKYVKDSVAKHKLHYDQLRSEGWTEAEAAAYVTARDATITTQFQYGREYAPRMFRGKARAIFVFKTFIQSYVMFLSTYPSAAVRSMLIMGALGGLMGLPGGDDLREILKVIGWRLFGKNFDLDHEARRLLIQMFGETESSREAADMILHGISRQGYMIPSFMDMIGGTVGVDIPMPVFDRSASISAGTILPVELGKLFGPPTQSQDAVIAGQAQRASGAVFGAGFNIYKALTNSKIDATDWKRWDKAVPRALGSLNKAQRIAREGRERTGTGSTLVNYDVRDSQELMEVIGIAMGYTPYRQSLQWNRVMAGQEAVKLWDIQRTGLMKQMGNAVLGKDQKEIDRVRESIGKFNSNLPPEARGKAITSDTLRSSLGTQARTRAAQEAESSVRKSDIPILREVQKLYPESQRTSARRVPKNLQ